jgi:hypothetical protein
MIAPALLFGAAAFGSSAIGAVGNYFKNRDALKFQSQQIDALERQDDLNFLRLNQEYDAYVLAETNAYYKDLENLERTYGFNARARQNSIETGLTALSDISDDLVNKAFSRNLKLAEVQGKRLATGQTGKSVRRLENLQQAAANRGAAQDAGTMERALGQFMFQEREAKFQQEVANQNAYNQVRKPVFGPRPVAPQDRVRPSDNTNRDLLLGLGKAAFDGVTAGLGKLPRAPFPGGGGGLTPAASGFPNYSQSPAFIGTDIRGSFASLYTPQFSNFGQQVGFNAF